MGTWVASVFKSCLPFNCPCCRDREAGRQGLADTKEPARSLLAEEQWREVMGLDLEAEAQETSTDGLLALDKSLRLPGPVPPPSYDAGEPT